MATMETTGNGQRAAYAHEAMGASEERVHRVDQAGCRTTRLSREGDAEADGGPRGWDKRSDILQRIAW
jgi:hypothetical protein